MPDAVAKRHSTRSEALGVAARMQAFRTLLTHLSQRYSRDPTALLREAGPDPHVGSDELGSNSGGGGHSGGSGSSGGESGRADSVGSGAGSSSVVAFDLMAINLADLEELPRKMAAIPRFFESKEALVQHAEVSRSRSGESYSRALAILRLEMTEAHSALGTPFAGSRAGNATRT